VLFLGTESNRESVLDDEAGMNAQSPGTPPTEKTEKQNVGRDVSLLVYRKIVNSPSKL